MVSEQPTRKMVRMFKDAGWTAVRTVGSHTVWECRTGKHSFSLPDGHKTISAGSSARPTRRSVAAAAERHPLTDKDSRPEVSMTSYDITITREGKWWMVKIPALDGLTQARRLADAEQMAKEYIAVTLDVPLSTVTLGHVAISVPGTADVESSLAEITALRTQAEEAEATAAKLVRTLASDMATAGVPVRDIGQMLGVSFQRASQLVNA